MNNHSEVPFSPPINRSSMAYRRFSAGRRLAVNWRWRAVVFFRRLVFLGLVVSSTYLGGKTIAMILSPNEPSRLKIGRAHV